MLVELRGTGVQGGFFEGKGLGIAGVEGGVVWFGITGVEVVFVRVGISFASVELVLVSVGVSFASVNVGIGEGGGGDGEEGEDCGVGEIHLGECGRGVERAEVVKRIWLEEGESLGDGSPINGMFGIVDAL